MDKTELLREVKAAKKSHAMWVSHAYALIQGIPLEKEQVPLNETECQFGIWYYGKGTESFGQLEVFKAIEEPHRRLHQIYMEIFAILFVTKKPGLLARFFGQSAGIDEKQKERAMVLYRDLQAASKEVVACVDALSEEIIQREDPGISHLSAVDIRSA